MKLSHIAAAVAIAATSLGASATTFTIDEEHDGNVVLITVNGSTYDVATHERIGTLDTGASFAAFCIELGVSFGSPFTGALESFTPAQSDQLSKLFTGAGWVSHAWESDDVANNDKAKITALQVGIWEIVYDKGNPFNLGDGKFAVNSDALDAYGSMISDWMSTGSTWMGDDIYALRDGLTGQRGNQQDLVIAVPEPSTYALMLAGLGAVGFVARRRARRG